MFSICQLEILKTIYTNVTLISKRKRVLATLFSLFIVFGIALNEISSSIDHFLIKELIMGITLLMSIKVLGDFQEKIDFIQREVSGDATLSVSIYKLKKIILLDRNVFVGVIPSLLYVHISLKMGFVALDPVGIFALFTLSCAVFFTALLLLNYTYFVYTIICISTKEINGQWFIITQNKWIVETSGLCKKCRNTFFVQVTFMVVVFILFAPSNLIQILIKHPPNNVIYWPAIIYLGSVFLYNVLILPALAVSEYFAIKKIVEDITNKSIQQFENNMVGIPLSENYKYLNSISTITKFRDDFLNTCKGNAVPITTFLFNIASVTLSAWQGLK